MQKYFFSKKTGKKLLFFLLTNYVYNVFKIVKTLIFNG